MEAPLSLSKQPSYVAQQNDGISVRLCLCAPPGHVRRIRRPKIGFTVRLASRIVVEIFELYLYLFAWAMLVRKRQNWKESLTPFFCILY